MVVWMNRLTHPDQAGAEEEPHPHHHGERPHHSQGHHVLALIGVEAGDHAEDRSLAHREHGGQDLGVLGPERGPYPGPEGHDQQRPHPAHRQVGGVGQAPTHQAHGPEEAGLVEGPLGGERFGGGGHHRAGGAGRCRMVQHRGRAPGPPVLGGP